MQAALRARLRSRASLRALERGCCRCVTGCGARRGDGTRAHASSSKSRTWYEEKYERDFGGKKGRKQRKPAYTDGGNDDGLSVSLVQWYPGHIAKAERMLQEQLKAVDVVLELRDARIAFATEHPELKAWVRNKPRVLVLNRVDMVSKSEYRSLEAYFQSQGEEVVGTNGQTGQGIPKLLRRAVSVSADINARRAAKGLLPREVRAAVVGFPNVGKSAVINRLVKRKACQSANTPGVTRQLRWLKADASLYLLDSPGVLPSRIHDQRAAQNLAICNDIGKASYLDSSIAGVMVDRIRTLPTADAILESISKRYRIPVADMSGEEYVQALADALFGGQVENAGGRLLSDYSKGAIGTFALELPPT